MGSALSRLRLSVKSFLAVVATYEELNKRIQESPGIPISNPSVSYWAIPAAPIAQHGCNDILPSFADVVIIGSGMTGTSVARTLLEFNDTKPLQICMLEARDVCSGASSRNGGHITPVLYQEYQELKKELGAEMAKSLLRFRLAHIEELIQVSKAEDILTESQCRKVETFDVFFEQDTFSSAIQNLNVYLNDLPDQRILWRVVGKEECVQDLQFSSTVVGAIATTAGSIHPYRFVTGVLSRLLERHPNKFRLLTHTPCLSIASKDNEDFYIVSTPKGTIRARHIIHATNAWASHLLPSMRAKIVPVRGHMSAQRPGTGLGRPQSAVEPTSPNSSAVTLTDPGLSWLGTRSFVMYGGGRYDYLTQQPYATAFAPQSQYPSPAAEFMFGGGVARGELGGPALMKVLGNANDRGWDLETGAYLSGALSMYFGGWGAEGKDREGEKLPSSDGVEDGRVKKLWTGILAVSADGRPWVGRVPAKMSGRPIPRANKEDKKGLAPAGEWIAAGYTGEGMVHAYLSGRTVAEMVLGNRPKFPAALLVTEARWKKAKIENLV